MPNIITAANSGLSRQALQQKADKQQVIRLFRGAYVDAQDYAELDPAGQYRVRAEAFLATHPKLRAWGITAAALEGAPVLSSAALHFTGATGAAKSRQAGCVFHEDLPDAPTVNNRIATMLFECAITSPLPDVLLAANYLFRRAAVDAGSGLTAIRDIDEETTEALLRQPLADGSKPVKAPGLADVSQLDTSSPGFLEAYSAARSSDFATPEAELLWMDFAQLCVAFGKRRAIRKALLAGLYFMDQAESPAESLLVANCVELGFAIPLLQVSILDPTSGQFLGRVNGLWPSKTVQAGLFQLDTEFGRLLYSKQLGDNESIIVEFDSQVKYEEDYAEVLEKERLRQNAIGNLGFRFVRINWGDLMQPDNLKSIFAAAKVPKARRG